MLADGGTTIADATRFAYMTGWRKSEVLGMTWDRVDHEGREVRLHTSKNNRPRTLCFEPEDWALIERRFLARSYRTSDGVMHESEFVFHAGDGRRVVDFKRSWATATKLAGVPGRLFHDLRRSFARDARRDGISESDIMAVGGWETRKVFQRYSITNPDDTKVVIARTRKHREARLWEATTGQMAQPVAEA